MLSGGESILVGLSGGPDSVCLLTALHEINEEYGLKLYALYIDHGLRPSDTPDEILFCKNLCQRLSVPFRTESIDVLSYAREHGLSKQEAARDLRYKTFDEVASAVGAGRVALGHTADDQLETFLMRVFRGSGTKGLSGIPPVRKRIIRPLIETERNDIEEFLEEQGIGFIVDSSNLTEDYLRNRIRLSIIPEIKKINRHVIPTVARTMEILREEEAYLEIIVTKTLMRLISRKTDFRIELFLTPMETIEKVVLRRLLRRAIEETRELRGMEFVHIEAIIDLIKRGLHGDRLYLPKGLRVIKNYSTLVITSEPPRQLGTVALPIPGEVVLHETGAVLRAAILEGCEDFGDGRTTALFDADKTGAVLTVRPRERGDFFYPLGFGKKKKLQDFFVDEKVPRDERDSVPVVVSGREIVWIAGHRGDERFRVTGETKRFLRMEFKAGLP